MTGQQLAFGDTPTDASDGFFRPGAMYRRWLFEFQCHAITTHPDTGRRAALGYIRWTRPGDGHTELWISKSLDDGDLSRWTEITKAVAA